VAADLIAYIPTIVHSWREPYEETWSAYALCAAAAWLALAVADFGVFAAVAYPAYLAVADTGVTGEGDPAAGGRQFVCQLHPGGGGADHHDAAAGEGSGGAVGLGRQLHDPGVEPGNPPRGTPKTLTSLRLAGEVS